MSDINGWLKMVRKNHHGDSIEDIDYGYGFMQLFINHTDQFIQNSDRKWYQFWKPKMIKNPHYDPNWEPTVVIDIKRGKSE